MFLRALIFVNESDLISDFESSVYMNPKLSRIHIQVHYLNSGAPLDVTRTGKMANIVEVLLNKNIISVTNQFSR